MIADPSLTAPPGAAAVTPEPQCSDRARPVGDRLPGGASLAGARVLSVRQPWLDLILAGIKTAETRTWPTAYRGPVLLHASAARPEPAPEITFAYSWEARAFAEAVARSQQDVTRFRRVLGVATLIECEPYKPLLVRAAGGVPYQSNKVRFAWHLADVRPIEPGIPWKGGLGLRKAPPELIAEVERSLTP